MMEFYTREKPVRASMDWKPNAHTAAGTRNRSRDALVQSEEITAALTCSYYEYVIIIIGEVHVTARMIFSI